MCRSDFAGRDYAFGVLIVLSVCRSDFPGRDYAFGVLIVLNLVLFLLIAAGQASIFLAVRANSLLPSTTGRRAQDLAIARRLITIAASDFLCWFPIGLLGVLAATGTPIPGEVSVGLAIFVLPLNSALNPFLYTLNLVLERARARRDEHLLKMLLKVDGEVKDTVG